MQLWGASGGNSASTVYSGFGRGAYTTGKIQLNKSTSLSVLVGASGDNPTSGAIYNGGGYAEQSGGGATDVRTVSGNLRSRIMVAGGGGGGVTNNSVTVSQRGDGGGINGLDAITNVSASGAMNVAARTGTCAAGKGGTQSSGGKTGTCGYDSYASSMDGAFGQGGYWNGRSSGGGGGWYGGGHGRHPGSAHSGGGGGSSYISGHAGCLAVASSTSNSLKSGCSASSVSVSCSQSWTGYSFTSTQMIAGNASMPNTAGTGNETGHSGNGYAKITWLGDTI